MKWIILLLLPLLSFSQNDDYNDLLKLEKKEFEVEVTNRIDSLEGSALSNFIGFLIDNNVDLLSYNKNLLLKTEKSQYPLDIFFLTKILIEQNTNKQILEKVLTNKKHIWDKGEWSQKFWYLIRMSGLSIQEENFYEVNDKGEKTYNLELYITEKFKANEIGNNPILIVDYNMINYTSGQFMSILKGLNIREIELTPKDKAVALYGRKGVDGMVDILTKK